MPAATGNVSPACARFDRSSRPVPPLLVSTMRALLHAGREPTHTGTPAALKAPLQSRPHETTSTVETKRRFWNATRQLRRCCREQHAHFDGITYDTACFRRGTL